MLHMPTTLLITILSLAASATHRGLHSFPTRRSSDLFREARLPAEERAYEHRASAPPSLTQNELYQSHVFPSIKSQVGLGRSEERRVGKEGKCGRAPKKGGKKNEKVGKTQKKHEQDNR